MQKRIFCRFLSLSLYLYRFYFYPLPIPLTVPVNFERLQRRNNYPLENVSIAWNFPSSKLISTIFDLLNCTAIDAGRICFAQRGNEEKIERKKNLERPFKQTKI